MASADLETLSQIVEERARANGHELRTWEARPGEEGTAWRAVCRRCGRAAYVRSEAGMAGSAGDALTQTCSG